MAVKAVAKVEKEAVAEAAAVAVVRLPELLPERYQPTLELTWHRKWLKPMRECQDPPQSHQASITKP